MNGRSEPGYYLAMPAGRAIDGWLIDEGDSVADGGPILTASTSELSVDMVVDVADADEFELGQSVSIEMADESVVDGEVVRHQCRHPAGRPPMAHRRWR